MQSDEIRVPKEIREFMPDGAQETKLGQKNGAAKQYRYGNLHIREYNDEFLLHVDKIDPRKDPLGHLAADAPEVLVGIACAVLCGTKATSLVKSKPLSIFTGLLSSALAGYVGYTATKKIKDFSR